VVLVILPRRPEPVAVVLAGASYADNLAVPHNALGWKGLLGVDAVLRTKPRWSWLSRPTLRPIGGPRSLDFRQDWDTLVAELAREKVGPKTVLIVLAMHGGSDSNGAYFLPNRATGPEDRLPLEHVIQSLAKLPPDKNKILVLEGAQIPADWRLGMVSNRFAYHLKALEPAIRKVRGLWVLSASDVDQRCWGSEGLGRTAFSHYLIEALRGEVAARGRQPSLDEFYQYLRRNVSNWAWNARGAVQEPVLFGPGAGEGGEAEELRRRRAREVPMATIGNAARPAQAPAFDRAGPEEEWKRFQKLDRSVPHPSVHSPWRWREFRARLIRYEELTRAGAADLSDSLTDRIRALETRLRAGQFFRPLPGSAGNTLVMEAIRGRSIDPSPSARPDFAALGRAANRSEAEKEWQKLRAADTDAGDNAPGRSLRAQVDDFLIQSAAKDPARALQRSALQLDVTRGTDYPQPAEAHFLRMLSLFLDKEETRPVASPFWNAAAHALKLRRDAEPAALGLSDQPREYSYCEQVHPWIRPAVEAGDQSRRQGEDRLFSSNEGEWAQSVESLAAARAAYQKAGDRARVVRSALAVRDRALSDLPEYSRWLASRDPKELEDDMCDVVEKLWATAHGLTEALEGSDDQEIEAPARNLGEGLRNLDARFRRYKSELSGDRLGKVDWVTASGAAAVAFADTDDLDLRKALWNRLENLAGADYEVYDKKIPATPATDARGNARRRLFNRSRVQARMALAALGRRWFDDPVFGNSGHGNFNKNSERLQAPVPDDEGEVADWLKNLAKACDAVAERWQRLSAEVVSLSGDKKEIPDDLSRIKPALVKADRLGRLIDAGVPSISESEPTERLRSVRVHDLLLWLADRTWKDHWYAEDPRGQQPYYRTAGTRFVGDAAQLFPESSAVKGGRALFAKGGRLGWEPQKDLILTSERGLRAVFRVVKTGDVPDGLPVVKPLTQGPIRLGEDEAGYRTVPPEGTDASVRFSVSRPLPPRSEFGPNVNHPRVEPAALVVAGYFRGQTFDATTRVDVHPLPEVIAGGAAPPDPPRASLAVRADQSVINRFGEGTGSIAIVLDCSGSMVDAPNSLAQVLEQPRSKFAQAKGALVKVLEQVPKGTSVSLWVFGQMRAGVTHESQFLRYDDQFSSKPELTIQPLLPKTNWGPGERKKLATRLDKLWPFYGTPLVAAMAKAMTDLDQARGLKTLLVLTDGDDDQFEKNAASKRGMTRSQFLKKTFDNKGVSVFMIFFQVPGEKKLEEAMDNFKVLTTLNPPGQLIPVKRSDKLDTALEQSLKQKMVCEILRGEKAVGEQPLDVTTPKQVDQWWDRGLEPGRYKLRVRADRPYTHEVELGRGDRLLVKLVEAAGGGIGFERALYSDDIPEAVGDTRGGSRLSVLAETCEDDRGRGFRALASLEPLNSPEPRLRLQLVRPRFTWFELGAKDARGEPDFATRWRDRAFFPAPCWQFDVPAWLTDPGGQGLARPVLRAWWGGDEEIAAASSALDLTGFDTPDAVDGLAVPLPGARTVVVESVRFEEHLVERRPGEEPQSEPCLVVRLDYRKEGGPVVVDPESLRLGGIEVEGHEHRLYTRARKSAGLFWPVTREQYAKLRHKPVGLVSLSRFRAEAEKRDHAVELNAIPPQVGTKLPKPPEAVRAPD
jgi:hypothetical protein